MRRVMMDATRDGAVRQLVDRPNAEAYVLKVPEPDESNAGPTGFVGVSDIVRSRQALAIEIEHSGSYPNYYRDKGARFVFEPDQVWDADNDSVVGALNSLGGEQASVPVYTQTLLATDNNVQIASPKMIRLKKWGRYSPARGVVGLLGIVRWTGAGNAPTVLFWTMDEYDDHGAAPLVSYQWDHNAAMTLTSDYVSATMPAFDMVEMDDGSIVAAVATNDDVVVYKSFDCGRKWIEIATFSITNTTWKIAINRVGSRLALVTSTDPGGGGGNALFSYHSDDGGITWSSSKTILTTAGAQTVIDIDMHMGQNGYMYLMFVTDVAGPDHPCWKVSTDGIFSTGYTASTAFVPTGPLAFCQEYYGRWLVYASDIVAFKKVYERHSDGTALGQNPWYELSNGKRINRNGGDGDGCDFEELCAREFFDGGFVDVVAMVHDNHVGDFWNLVVYRLCMWSGVQFDRTVNEWDAVWTPHAYPSTNDPHPNLNVWTEAQGGAGAIVLGNTNDFHHMEVTCGAGADVKTYRYPAAGSDGAWDNGLTVRFELKVVSGYAKVNCRLTSAISNKDVNFTVQFQTDRVILWDENAGMGADIIVPTDWDPSAWNEYVVIAKENEVQVFRSPSGTYREIAHYEEIVKYETLQENAYAGAGDNRVMWGISNALGNANGTTESHWRSMMALEDEAFSVDWDFASCYGKRCHCNTVGLLQGFGCKWAGDFAVDDDEWELDVGAHFDADNIFVDSPRICFSDPEDAAARSADIVIDWRRHEGDGATCMNYVFDSIAVFGLNTPVLKLEGGNFAGMAWTTLWCNLSALSFPFGGPTVYEPGLLVNGTPDQNVLRFVPGTSNIDTWPLPNQFASTRWRKWYVYVVDGICSGHVYRVDGNDGDRLFLERNVEADGVHDGDAFILFADRFLHVFGQTFTYPRVRLTMLVNGVTPSPSEEAVRLGTMVLGQTYDLPDDEWESVITTESGVEVTRGRSRIEKWRETAPERRSVGLSYTGETDRGMGSDIVRELYRHARWGVHPVVWIDDDTALDEWSGACLGSSVLSHVDPILARVNGPISQQRKFYSHEQQDGKWHVRGAHDVSGVTLEEIL